MEIKAWEKSVVNQFVNKQIRGVFDHSLAVVQLHRISIIFTKQPVIFTLHRFCMKRILKNVFYTFLHIWQNERNV